jgi:hypothetical protein
MRTLLTWIGAILITGIIISPFFWLRFLKNKKVIIYLITSSFISVIFFLLSLTWIYNFILKHFINTYDSLGYFDLFYIIYPVLYLLLVVISPFIFTKILYGKFSLKSVIISIFCSIAIFIAIALIFTYYIFPMAGEVLLKNI